MSSLVIFLPSTIVNLPTPGKTSDFKISVAVAVAPIRQTFDFSREFCPWSPQSLNCRSYLSSKYTKYKFPKNIFHDLIIDKFYRLAFAFCAPDDDGDDGNVSFPPGEGVEAILLLLTKITISSMAGLFFTIGYVIYYFVDVGIFTRNIVFKIPATVPNIRNTGGNPKLF